MKLIWSLPAPRSTTTRHDTTSYDVAGEDDMSEMVPERPMLPLAEYAEAAGKSLRTVQRWIADGLLPGARQDDEGKWWIPADARPDDTRRRTTSQPVVVPDTVAGSVPALPSPLGVLGTLEEAAELLDTTVGGVRRMGRDGLLTVGPYGPHGALRVFAPPR